MGGRNLQVNGQDQIVHSGYYCNSSIDEENSQGKITMTLIQTVSPNCIALRAGKQWAHSAEAGALRPVFEKSATDLALNTY